MDDVMQERTRASFARTALHRIGARLEARMRVGQDATHGVTARAATKGKLAAMLPNTSRRTFVRFGNMAPLQRQSARSVLRRTIKTDVSATRRVTAPAVRDRIGQVKRMSTTLRPSPTRLLLDGNRQPAAGIVLLTHANHGRSGSGGLHRMSQRLPSLASSIDRSQWAPHINRGGERRSRGAARLLATSPAPTYRSIATAMRSFQRNAATGHRPRLAGPVGHVQSRSVPIIRSNARTSRVVLGTIRAARVRTAKAIDSRTRSVADLTQYAQQSSPSSPSMRLARRVPWSSLQAVSGSARPTNVPRSQRNTTKNVASESMHLARYGGSHHVPLQYRAHGLSGGTRPTPAASSLQHLSDVPAVSTSAAVPHRDMTQLRTMVDSMLHESVLSPKALSVFTETVTAEQERREALENYRVRRP
jgi:hypothetical protein